MPEEAPVTRAVDPVAGGGMAKVRGGYPRRRCRDRPGSMIGGVEGSGFNIFGGDPDELRDRLGELADQMQGAQRVAWADNAIRLAVEMTVAAINRLELSGSSDQQAMQVRDAIRIVFPESVTLVREAREGLS